MKRSLLFIFLQIAVLAGSAQTYCIPGRFDTLTVFSPGQLDSANVQYGMNQNWDGSTAYLNMTVYYPNLSLDALTRRPCVLLIHGGSFRSGSRYDLINEVKYFAARGYVSASIDYRLGWVYNNPADCYGDNNLHINAVYRTVQDTKAALRYLSAHSAEYGIDSNYFFVGGTSAGAFASLGVAYITQDDFNNEKPGISSLLGPLDSATNALTDPFRVIGLLSYKGAMWDTTVINGTNAIPGIFIHGTADPYYPFYTGTAYTCSNYFSMQGSGLLTRRLGNLGVCYELNYKIMGDHGEIYPASYTLGRRALFMRDVLCEQCNSRIVEDQVVIDTLIVGISRPASSPAIAIKSFPNPVDDYLMLTTPSDEPLRYELYSMSMQRIMEGSFISETRLDISPVPSGMYLMIIYDQNSVIVDRIKIVKQDF